MYNIVAHFSGLSGPYFDQKHHFSNAGGHEVRYSPNKALIFRIIRYLTEYVSNRSGKNEPIAKITDLRSDTATAMLQLVPACGLEATVKLTVHCSLASYATHPTSARLGSEAEPYFLEPCLRRFPQSSRTRSLYCFTRASYPLSVFMSNAP
ncbi:hypothetical protein [Paenibacillus sp. NPDC093718]|uniref:hypothetical protein n=1 Tax=Paenibacillus sp. NPDC093718 TaxID=3390601 RepID=UPI003CFD738C